MDKFDFGSFDSSNSDIAFSSDRGYADPSSELETRKQLSWPLKELKDYVNDVAPVDTDDNTVQIVVSDSSIGYKTDPLGDVTDIEFPTGIPTGGSANQVLTKSSNTDFDVTWQDVSTTSKATIISRSNASGYAGETKTGLPEYKLLVFVQRYASSGTGGTVLYTDCFPMESGSPRYIHADDYCREVTMTKSAGGWTLSISGNTLHNRTGEAEDGTHCIPVRVYGYL